jgi:putative membrane-bound dehydrogenase-like protein
MLFAVLTAPGIISAADRTPAPLPPAKAAASMVVPDGFKVTLVAAEPDVVQPISFTIDARGRLWVAEALNYGEWKVTGKDRIVILEEREGGVKRTLFYEGFNYITGIEVGFGGVWVMSPPNLYFVPDRDRDDKPDGDPEILLNGFGYKESRHNLANGFTWGPDGWLYGGHGRTSPSDVGRPGTPADKRIHCDGGVFRIHPTRLIFENFADGTTNPWGVDFDDYGECFVSNCVNPHLFHMIPGGHYEPWRNRPSSLYAYERITTIADHLHYPTGKPGEMRGETSEVLAMGGGHAHCGTLVYLGDSFPKEFRNTVFMCNVHGRRINNDILKRRGSSYVASHAKDFMISGDPWFMGVTLRTGPDGSIYVSDWSDTGECHTYKPERGTGRIYKISHGEPKLPTLLNLEKLTDKELVDLHRHKNDFLVRHARRILQERAVDQKRNAEARDRLHAIVDAVDSDVPSRLRGMWTLHVIGGITSDRTAALLRDRSEHVRAWMVRLLCEKDVPPDTEFTILQQIAEKDGSMVVRLALASALQRLPLEKRWTIAEPLIQHAADVSDQNLPLMYWYGIEPLMPADPSRALTLVLTSEIPLLRRFGARRIVEEAPTSGEKIGLTLLVNALATADEKTTRDLLVGVRDGLRGRKGLPMPSRWPAVYSRLSRSDDAEIRGHAVVLALVFGDPQALADLRKVALNTKAEATARVAALEALVEQRIADLAPLLHGQLLDTATRRTALRGLAAYPHHRTPELVLAVYTNLTSEEKADAIATLASRADFALALLGAIERKSIPRGDISAYAARQMFALNDSKVTARVREVWGDVRETPEAKKKQLTRYRAQLTPAVLKNADPRKGRAVFTTACANCHKLYGEGGAIGPDLTGSNRGDLDYLLANLIDPGSEVGRDFRMSIVRTKDERLITGIIVEQSAARVVIQNDKERISLSPEDVDSIKESPLSIMPEGQLDSLSREQVRDLFAYLMGKTQAPLLVELKRE